LDAGIDYRVYIAEIQGIFLIWRGALEGVVMLRMKNEL
jgi:hypothetical protein